MRVLLIDPTFSHQGKLVKLKRVGYFPLTLPSLAACFPENVQLTLLYEKVQTIDVSIPCDLVMFTTMGSNVVRACELSAQFRQRGVKTVVGGFSALPFLELCKGNFDSVVIGDGEELIPNVVKDARKGLLKKVYENLNPSIENIPAPRYDMVPKDVVGEIVPIEASRGCPNCCDFCAVSSLYRSKFRKRAVDQVLRDFFAVKKLWGKRLYYFTDPNFTADISHAKAILRGIMGCNVKWLASVDIRSLKDHEFLRLAAASGCFSLQVGFETLSDKELESVNKTFAIRSDFPKLIRSCQDFGIPIVALMMVGFDGDSPETFRGISRFLEKNRISLGVIHPLIPVPTTPFYKKLEAEGRLIGVDPNLADGLHLFFRPKNFSKDEFIEKFWRLNSRIFSLRSIVRRFLFPKFFKSPLSYLILLFTNLFLAPKVVSQKLPMGLYE